MTIARKKTVYLESLGCNKNTVDSEIMLAMLAAKGYRRTSEPEDASLILVNTCAFIDDAKEEAVNAILELARRKSTGSRMVVAGCLTQIHHRDLLEGIPEVDAVIGIGNLEYLLDAITSGAGERAGSESSAAGAPDRERDFPESRAVDGRYREYRWGRELITPKGYAYLKIAEGCGRRCSFCLIPAIRGKQRSRTIGSLVEEAKTLEGRGVRELILTSQDTLSYGKDLEMKRGLTELVERLVAETRIDFFRLLYLRPGKELLESLEIFGHERVLPYFDIPVQHVSPAVLRKMNRGGGYESYLKMTDLIRGRFPDAVLRTTLMVGFPGEGEEEYDLLTKFVEEVRFDHLGVFRFSPQPGTGAASLEGRAASRVAGRRRDALLARQREISRERLRRNLGKTFDVLVEERFEGDSRYIGRSYHFAPEVDGLFMVESKKTLAPGDLVKAVVTSSDDYDLYGRLDLYGH
jgi:ribosomal protein S12 methylthiotransferase